MFEEFTAQYPTLAAWLPAVIILVLSAIAGRLFYYLVKGFISRMARHTSTTLDDKLIKVLSRPLFFLILILGARFAAEVSPYVMNHPEIVFYVFTVLMTFIVAYTIVRCTHAFFEWKFESQKWSAGKKTPYIVIQRTFTIVIYAVAILIMFTQLGVAISPILASLGVGGLAVALALQSTLSNYFASIYLTTDKTIHLGDFIELEGTAISGTVEEITWRATKIRQLSNNQVVIPNSKLADSVLINHQLPESSQSLLIPVGVAYGSNLEKVESVCFAVATKLQKQVAGIDPDFKPIVFFTEFADSSINLLVIVRIKSRLQKGMVTHEFIKAIAAAFAREGIEIPFPQRDVHLHQSSQ